MPFYCLFYKDFLIKSTIEKTALWTEGTLPTEFRHLPFKLATNNYSTNQSVYYHQLDDDFQIQTLETVSLDHLELLTQAEYTALALVSTFELRQDPSNEFYKSIANACLPHLNSAWSQQEQKKLHIRSRQINAFKTFDINRFNLLIFSSTAMGLLYGLLVAGRDKGWVFSLLGLLFLFALDFFRPVKVRSPLTIGLMTLSALLISSFSIFSSFPNHFWTMITLVPLLALIGVAQHAERSIEFKISHVFPVMKRVFVEPFIHLPFMTTLRTQYKKQTTITVAQQNRKDILLGLLFAVPIFCVALVLLSASDAVFGHLVENALNHLDDLFTGKWVYRIIVGIVLSVLTFIALLTTHIPPEELNQNAPEKNWRRLPVLIVLGSVGSLYAFYTIVQVSHLYLGFGELPAGVTYANYARNGFFELLLLSVLTLISVLVLHSKTDEGSPKESRIFKILHTAMCLMTLQFLATSFYKLGLYETAYGYTYLRLWVQSVTIGIALCYLWILQWIWHSKSAWFHKSILTFFILFTASTFILNDYTIAALNVHHYESLKNQTLTTQNAKDYTPRTQKDIDKDYLCSLSMDAAPIIFSLSDDNADFKALKNDFYARHIDEKNSRDPLSMSLLFYIGSHAMGQTH